VKNAQLRVFGPIFNWYASQLAAKKGISFLESWPLAAMNNMPDQLLLTRLLTAGRKKLDRWTRTCLVFRPFHATNPPFASQYSVSRPSPPESILQRRDRELTGPGTGTSSGQARFWRDFRGKADPYIQMLNTVWYANFFLASVPRLDFERYLPRIEFIVPSPVYESSADPVTAAQPHLERLIGALRETGFEVSVEHSMYRDKSTIEVLPALLTRTHDTVKVWAQELLSRVDEYLSAILTRVISTKKARGVRIRPFTKEEFRLLHEALRRERLQLVGSSESDELEA
ncbi:MAG TPA: hypothetical protein VLV89_05980, partial [Candidatus Acidoferrum sp.]|nr:hypothetical protein [Candidatus Acidoferrum sp.]